jgi:hypothetical protein
MLSPSTIFPGLYLSSLLGTTWEPDHIKTNRMIFRERLEATVEQRCLYYTLIMVNNNVLVLAGAK